jgi:hypothetical protein
VRTSPEVRRRADISRFRRELYHVQTELLGNGETPYFSQITHAAVRLLSTRPRNPIPLIISHTSALKKRYPDVPMTLAPVLAAMARQPGADIRKRAYDRLHLLKMLTLPSGVLSEAKFVDYPDASRNLGVLALEHPDVSELLELCSGDAREVSRRILTGTDLFGRMLSSRMSESGSRLVTHTMTYTTLTKAGLVRLSDIAEDMPGLPAEWAWTVLEAETEPAQ